MQSRDFIRSVVLVLTVVFRESHYLKLLFCVNANVYLLTNYACILPSQALSVVMYRVAQGKVEYLCFM